MTTRSFLPSNSSEFKQAMEEDKPLSRPHQHPLSLPHSHPHSPPSIEYTPLPFPTHKPQRTFLFLPSFPHPLPSMPLRPYGTILHEHDNDEDEEPHHALNNNDIEPPFPWATCKRAIVHTLQHLSSHGLTTITGKVKCRKCDVEKDIGFDLLEKFGNLASFIAKNKSNMKHRATGNWENHVLPNCESCGNENCMRPVIDNNNERINWLFLLLGEMIGCCTLKHLKYFCKYTKAHTSGARNRLIYSTYLGICKQLDPNGPFNP